MVQVLPHARCRRRPTDQSEPGSGSGSGADVSACVCVGLGLGPLILNFLNNASLKILGSKVLSLTDWVCCLQQLLTVDRIQLSNCCMIGL